MSVSQRATRRGIERRELLGTAAEFVRRGRSRVARREKERPLTVPGPNTNGVGAAFTGAFSSGGTLDPSASLTALGNTIADKVTGVGTTVANEVTAKGTTFVNQVTNAGQTAI